MSGEETTSDAGATTTGFERALEGLRETGASVAMRELVELLAKHGSEEGRLLAAYQKIASTTEDKAARYLIDLIMDDERRHHRLLVEMATAMAWDTIDPDASGTPALAWHLDDALVTATRELREYEERDRHELEVLRRQLRPFEDTTLWSLIVHLILLDTEKHAAILRFIEDHAKSH